MKSKVFLSACIFLVLGTCVSHADSTLFWYSTGDTDWNNPDNWWSDLAILGGSDTPAGGVPQTNDQTLLYGDVAPIADLDTWVQPASIDSTGLTSDAQATGLEFTSALSAQDIISIQGNVTFLGSATLNAVISGDATFNSSSQLYSDGVVNGNALFNGESSQNNGGAVTGTKTRRYTSYIVTSRDFTSDGPWTVLADNATVNIYFSTYDNTTTLTAVGTGSFVNAQPPPSPTTDGSGSIIATKATLHGSESDTSVKTHGFVYGTTTGYGATSTEFSQFGYDNTPYSLDILGLTASTTYHFAAYAIADYGTGYGDDLTFTTLPVSAPSVSISAASGVGSFSAILNASIDDIGGDNPFERGFMYGTTTSYGATSTPETGSFDSGPFSVSISDLSVLTTYHFRAYASNSEGTTYSNDRTFTTQNYPPPTVETDPATSVTSTSATFNGTVISTGGTTVLSRGFTYGTTTAYGSTTIESGSFGTGTFSSVVSNLDSGLVYHYRSYASTTAGISYGVDSLLISVYYQNISRSISVGSVPQYSSVVGTKLYSINTGSNSISVIDTVTDTVLKTIAVGSAPQYSQIVGTKLYVANFTLGNADGSISVIDTVTDTVLKTIAVHRFPYSIGVVGSKIYVTNSGDVSVSVIDTLTDTVVDTIPVGNYPTFSFTVGTKLYVSNSNDVNISVIDTTTDTVVATIPSLPRPVQGIVVGNRIYIMNSAISNVSSSNSVSVIDGSTDKIISIIMLGADPVYASLAGTKLYVTDRDGGILSIIDTASDLDIDAPHLVSFTSTSASGKYSAGDTVNITANFGEALAGGSAMTVILNTGKSVVLNSISGTTISGIYTITDGDTTPDLAVSSVANASVSDTHGHVRTKYSLPISQGLLTAENSFITRNLGDSKNIVIGSYPTILTGNNPYQVSTGIIVNGGTYIYVANQGDGTVSVIRTSDNALVSTITVGSEPYGLTPVSISGTTYIYVANTGSNSVSVINTSTNAIVATIPVGVKPYYAEHIGTNVYVTNGQSNNVSIINANNNMVTGTTTVGLYPRGIKAHGTDLYVANYGNENYGGGNYISVIDSVTGSTTPIILPGTSTGPRGITVLGNKVYVANFRSNNISVIDTGSKTVIDTIQVGMGPRGMSVVGSYVYVENFDDGTISVINTLNDTVIKTVVVGNAPSGMGIVGTNIYVSRFQDAQLSILDTVTNSLKHLPSVQVDPPPSVPPSKGGGSSSGGSAASVAANLALIYKQNRVVSENNPVLALGPISHASFQHSLNIADSGKDVGSLQKYLNAHGFMVAKKGPGSSGKETLLFGSATQNALKNFQKKHGIPATGFFGPLTRAYVLKHP